MPDRVYFEPDALKYELGERLRGEFPARGIPIFMTTSHNRVTKIPATHVEKLFLLQNVRWSSVFDAAKTSKRPNRRPIMRSRLSLAARATASTATSTLRWEINRTYAFM